MRSSSFVVAVVMSGVLGCGGSETHQGAPVTVTITSPVAPALVAFRDGFDADWQPATPTSNSTFEVVVHGPYIVAVVCTGTGSDGVSRTSTAHTAQTPDDPRQITGCVATPPTHKVTGHMVQAGAIQLGEAGARSTVADWNFEIAVPDGTFDLVATTDQAVMFRRGVAVKGDLAIAPAIDVASGGTALVPVAFSAPNAAPDETLSVSVGLLGPTDPALPARVYLGPLATARAVPSAGLLATDTQSASVRAAKGGTALRALRRPFRVGNDTAFVLPPPLGVTWSTDGGLLAVGWSVLPDHDVLSVFAAGTAVGGRMQVDYEVAMSARFLTATAITKFAIDTDIPGFQKAWTIDLAAGYSRDATVQQGTELGTLTTSEVTETVPGVRLDPPPPGGRARAGE